MSPQPPDPTALGALPWWFDLLTFAPILIVLAVCVYFARQGYSGFKYIKKQSDFLDHQKDVPDRALEQNKTFEDMIAHQYTETNQRSDRALAQSEEALRLHAAALNQLTEMNAALARVSRLLEAGSGRPG